MDSSISISLDEILLQVETCSPKKVLFYGEGTGEISSYVAGWMAGKGIDVILLDGANRFDPYMVSSFAKKVLIPPESLLKRIRIARAFTCYQMATLIEEKLVSLLKQEGASNQTKNLWVILLGPITTFLDEDVSEREVRPLFERSLRRMEEMAMGGTPFLLFQPAENLPFPPFAKGGCRHPEPSAAEAMDTVVQSQIMEPGQCRRPYYGAGRVAGLKNSKRVYLLERLFQFANLIWKTHLDDEEPKVVLEKKMADGRWPMADRKNLITST